MIPLQWYSSVIVKSVDSKALKEGCVIRLCDKVV